MATELANTPRRQIYSPPAHAHEIRNTIDWCMSGSVCDGSTGYKIALINLPSDDERGRLTARHKELMAALREHDRKEIGALIAEMLAGYDVGRQKYKTAKDRMQAVATYVAELKGVPTWAVAIACEKIRMGTAPDISHAWEPTTIQVRVLAVSVAQPYKTEVKNIGNILTAEKYQRPIDEAQRARVGVLMRELADELRNRFEDEKRDAVERDAPRARALSDQYIELEYRMHGEEPRRNNKGALISRSLAQMIAKL